LFTPDSLRELPWHFKESSGTLAKIMKARDFWPRFMEWTENADKFT
jgi:hypothetical protein